MHSLIFGMSFVPSIPPETCFKEDVMLKVSIEELYQKIDQTLISNSPNENQDLVVEVDHSGRNYHVVLTDKDNRRENQIRIPPKLLKGYSKQIQNGGKRMRRLKRVLSHRKTPLSIGNKSLSDEKRYFENKIHHIAAKNSIMQIEGAKLANLDQIADAFVKIESQTEPIVDKLKIGLVATQSEIKELFTSYTNTLDKENIQNLEQALKTLDQDEYSLHDLIHNTTLTHTPKARKMLLSMGFPIQGDHIGFQLDQALSNTVHQSEQGQEVIGQNRAFEIFIREFSKAHENKIKALQLKMAKEGISEKEAHSLLNDMLKLISLNPEASKGFKNFMNISTQDFQAQVNFTQEGSTTATLNQPKEEQNLLSLFGLDYFNQGIDSLLSTSIAQMYSNAVNKSDSSASLNPYLELQSCIEGYKHNHPYNLDSLLARSSDPITARNNQPDKVQEDFEYLSGLLEVSKNHLGLVDLEIGAEKGEFAYLCSEEINSQVYEANVYGLLQVLGLSVDRDKEYF